MREVKRMTGNAGWSVQDFQSCFRQRLPGCMVTEETSSSSCSGKKKLQAGSLQLLKVFCF